MRSHELQLVLHGHEGQTSMGRYDLWSALQTRLQGLDWATLAMMIAANNHAQPSFLGSNIPSPIALAGGIGKVVWRGDLQFDRVQTRLSP